MVKKHSDWITMFVIFVASGLVARILYSEYVKRFGGDRAAL